MPLDLRSELNRYGVPRGAVKSVDTERDVSLLRYSDLFQENMARKPLNHAPMSAGLIEFDNRPLMRPYCSDSLTRWSTGSTDNRVGYAP